MVFVLMVGVLVLFGCGVINSGNGEFGGFDVGFDNVNMKWVDCIFGYGLKDIIFMKVDGKKDIIIGVFNGWDEFFVIVGIMKNVLEKDGYKVMIKGFDVGLGYVGFVVGDIDFFIDGWLLVIYVDYVKWYGDKMENFGCWYDNVKLIIVVNKDFKVCIIGDFKIMGDEYDNILYGIEVGVGLIKVIKDLVILKYGLKNFNFKILLILVMLV